MTDASTRPFRVLHLLGSARAEHVSVANIVAALARNVDPQEFELHAWFLDGDGPLVEMLADCGVTTRVIDRHGVLRNPRCAWRFLQQLRRERFAIVHQYTGGRWLRWLAHRASAARQVVHRISRVNERWGLRPMRFDDQGPDAVIAIAHAVAATVVHRRTHVVHAGVRSDPTPPPSLAPDGALIIGTACRLVPAKALDHLLEAFAPLAGEFPSARLEIAGHGPLRESLERRIAELGLGQRASLLGWRNDIGRTMRGWTIYAQPSLDEGCPIAVLDAMAVGLPIAATAAGGTPELVDDERTALLVPVADPPALSRALRRLLADAELRTRLGDAAHRDARERFSETRMAAAVVAVYREVLALDGTR